jgi:hypothetical protein
MLRSGLSDEYGLASLQHEMTVAAHLMSKGFDVTFSDIESGNGFDLLAQKEGIEIEVECKTHSADIGRKVHRRRVYQLEKHIISIMNSALDNDQNGKLVRIIVPKRLDGNNQHLQTLAACFVEALRNRMSLSGPEPCAIEYRTFPLTGSPFDTVNPRGVKLEHVRQYLEDQIGFPIGHALMLFRPKRGAVVVTVESAQPDKVMDGVVRRLKELVKNQLTGRQPSLICIRFSDLAEDGLLRIAKDDKAGRASSLQRATSMLLDRDDWEHVHTVAYTVPGHADVSTSVNDNVHTKTIQGIGSHMYLETLITRWLRTPV